MEDIKISDLQSVLISLSGELLWTEHVSMQMRERKIKRADVLDCIKNGEIIEQYPNAYPYPACLISAEIKNGKSIHVVAGINDNELSIITAYYPSLDKWENDYKTRKAGK